MSSARRLYAAAQCDDDDCSLTFSERFVVSSSLRLKMAATCTMVDLPSSVLPQIFAALAEQPYSLPDLCCCLCVCKHWNEVVSCRQLWSVLLHCAPHMPLLFCINGQLVTSRRCIKVPLTRADKLTSTDLKKLVARSSDQVLSLNLSWCNRVRTYTIMQVLLCNQQLEEVLTVGLSRYMHLQPT